MHTIDEPVHIVEYDRTWPAQFSTECARIATALNIDPQGIAHIGSTAVPNLAAKPTVDIMLGVSKWPPPNSLGGDIVRLGYESLGEAGVPERLYFRRRDSGNFNLHVVRLDGNHWRSNIALRDYLRDNPSARDRYAKAKRGAIASGAESLLKYSEAKSVVVSDLLQEAFAHQNAS